MPLPVSTRLAPAKINLTLHVIGQRADGYHLLDSLVVFADCGDEVSLRPGSGLALDVSGPYAPKLGPAGDNLVLRAARLIGAQGVALSLDKRLPVASGMGGGSSDAAAALHLLAGWQGVPVPSAQRAMTLGADLPVCLAAPHPSRLRGLGERVDPVPDVPPLWMLLVNPGAGLATPDVFNALACKENSPLPETLPRWRGTVDFCAWLASQRNDLEDPAQAKMPAVTDVLAQLSAQPGCLLARMTGSGATCFGLFADLRRLNAAAQVLACPGWFVQATRSAGSLS